jgi:hypothetical protein
MAVTLSALILFFIFILSVPSAFSQKPIQDFDTMGDVNCEDEHARLDSVAVQLNQVPGAKVVIIFYGAVFSEDGFRDGMNPRRARLASDPILCSAEAFLAIAS